jgi:hypothetical protein
MEVDIPHSRDPLRTDVDSFCAISARDWQKGRGEWEYTCYRNESIATQPAAKAPNFRGTTWPGFSLARSVHSKPTEVSWNYFHKNTALVLSSNAIFYMKYSCVQASLSPLLMKIYGLNTLQVGLTYLAFGIASALASYGAGKISDYDYRKTALAHGFSINKVSGDKLLEFPIEKARL